MLRLFNDELSKRLNTYDDTRDSGNSSTHFTDRELKNPRTRLKTGIRVLYSYWMSFGRRPEEVNITTSKDDCYVTMGNVNNIVVATDVLSPKKYSYLPHVMMDVFIGQFLHEMSHVLYTGSQKVLIRTLINKYGTKKASVIKDIFNILEDERIERILCSKYRGYTAYIQALRWHFFKNYVPQNFRKQKEETAKKKYARLYSKVLSGYASKEEEARYIRLEEDIRAEETYNSVFERRLMCLLVQVRMPDYIDGNFSLDTDMMMYVKNAVGDLSMKPEKLFSISEDIYEKWFLEAHEDSEKEKDDEQSGEQEGNSEGGSDSGGENVNPDNKENSGGKEGKKSKEDKEKRPEKKSTEAERIISVVSTGGNPGDGDSIGEYDEIFRINDESSSGEEDGITKEEAKSIIDEKKREAVQSSKDRESIKSGGSNKTDTLVYKVKNTGKTYKPDSGLKVNASVIRRILERGIIDTTATLRGVRNGKLDTSKLVDAVVGSENVYYGMEEGVIKKISVCLLIDQSYSMTADKNGKNLSAHCADVAFMFDTALKGLNGINYYCYGFSTDVNIEKFYSLGSSKHVIESGKTTLITYREPNHIPKSIYGNIVPIGNNNDAKALHAAGDRVRKFTTDPVVLIMLSDGAPSYFGSGTDDEPLVKEVRDEVDRLKKHDISVIHIEIAAKSSLSSRMYDTVINFKDSKNLSADVGKVLKEKIRKHLRS